MLQCTAVALSADCPEEKVVMKLRCGLAVASLLVLCAGVRPAGANPVTFAGTSGSLSAWATFSVSGSNLFITLSNQDDRVFTGTKGDQALKPSELLTALYFTIDGVTSLSSVNMTAESVVNGTGTPGQNWQYVDNLSGAPGGAGSGVSAVGLGIFGPSGNFATGGQNLQGASWAIVGANYTPGTGVGNLPSMPLIQSSAVFELTGLPPGFDESSIGAVSFQWGTSLSEPNAPGVPVPEPSTLSLLLASVAFAFLGWFAMGWIPPTSSVRNH
jgi:hypothetical protein